MKPLILLIILLLFSSCEPKQNTMTKIVFLHHSTGQSIWIGKTNRYIYKFTKRNDVQSYFSKYNSSNKTNYLITERSFPAMEPYGWQNYPFDYYNIWVKNSGDNPFMNEPTLELLTKEYDVIIFKHCYPVSNILEDTGNPDINSKERRIENYKLQYNALKKKMHEFPQNKFIVWTPAVMPKSILPEDKAQRTKEFYQWMINAWDDYGDNIFIWDFYKYETEGGLFLKDEYSTGLNDAHPNKQFAGRIAPLFSQFIINVIEGTAE